jgi:hypothetical protein
MFEIVGEIVLQLACLATGHGVLWTLTLGRWKPLERDGDVAEIVGLVFWGVLVASAAFLIR